MVFLSISVVSISLILIFTDFPALFSALNWHDYLYYFIILGFSVLISLSPKIALPIVLFLVVFYEFVISFALNKFCLPYNDEVEITVSSNSASVNFPPAVFDLDSENRTSEEICINLVKIPVNQNRMVFTYPYFYALQKISYNSLPSQNMDEIFELYKLSKLDKILMNIVLDKTSPELQEQGLPPSQIIFIPLSEYQDAQYLLELKYSSKFAYNIRKIL